MARSRGGERMGWKWMASRRDKYKLYIASCLCSDAVRLAAGLCPMSATNTRRSYGSLLKPRTRASIQMPRGKFRDSTGACTPLFADLAVRADVKTPSLRSPTVHRVPNGGQPERSLRAFSIVRRCRRTNSRLRSSRATAGARRAQNWRQLETSKAFPYHDDSPPMIASTRAQDPRSACKTK